MPYRCAGDRQALLDIYLRRQPIEAALNEIASWDSHQWNAAEAASIRLASKFGPQIFADSVDRFIDVLLSPNREAPARHAYHPLRLIHRI